MDQPNLKKRPSGPRPFRLSLSENRDASHRYDTIESNIIWPIPPSDLNPEFTPMDTTQHIPEDQSSQARILHMRQARFRGLAVPARKVTPTSSVLPTTMNSDHASTAMSDLSTFDSATQTGMRRLSDDLGILQEISNSSLRRKRSHKLGEGPLSDPTRDTNSSEENLKPQAQTVVERGTMQTTNSYPTIAANSSLPLRSETLKTPRARVARAPRSPIARKIANNDPLEYIEHLESQLAALQTQLQALTSPSTSRTQSAKLRALNSESRMLRQEVADWERKFHERIGEQLEQHNMVVGSLKAQIKSLQRELETNAEKMKELAVECEGKTGQIIAAEGANYDLERRLEFMSELLATSPSKINFRCEAPFEARRITGPRPMSSGSARATAMPVRQMSPQRDRLASHRRLPTLSPESPTRRSSIQAWEDNPFDRLVSQGSGNESSTESESVMSDGTPSERPGARRSLSNFIQSDSETKARPTRRMRRFYTGSMGPRSLILPATTQVESLSVSTPVTGTAPSLPSFVVATPTHAQPLGFKLPISPERPQLHKRSATWDDHQSFISRSRNGAVVLTPTQIPSSPFASNAATPIASQQNSTQSAASHTLPLGSVQARNLFEELSRIKHEGSSSGKNTDSVPSSTLKHNGSPLPSPLPSPILVSDVEDRTSHNMVSLTSLVHKVENCTLLNPALSTSPAQESENIDSSDSEQPAKHFSVIETDPSSKTPATPGNRLRSAPIRLIERLMAFVSQTLDSSTPSVTRVVTNAWSIVTLSRPVLEFRWWLVRLLIGGLREKRRLQLLVARSPTHGLGISTSPGLITPRSTKRSILPRRPPLGALTLGLDDDHNNDADDGGDADDEIDVEVRQPPKPPPPLPPVAWLKFSMTLVFAVGVALKDGPASLFRTRPGACLCAEAISEQDEG